MNINHYFEENDWHVVEELFLEEKKAGYFEYGDLPISEKTRSFLKECYKKGIYKHQKLAISEFLKGANVCLSTGTASGKSLIFYVAAIEIIIKNPNAKILAVYPLKALAKEQEERWIKALNSAGIEANVGRIDGQVAMSERKSIINNSQILIVTPDIIHAWLMFNLSQKNITKFLSNLKIIVVDEVHVYTGVFGSNSAFLFRRLNHILNLLGSSFQYVAASATIADPKLHLRKLFSSDFNLISSDNDTSPRKNIRIKFLESPNSKDFLTALSDLFVAISKDQNYNFISFVDSRKQTEYLASITSRAQNKEQHNELFNVDHLSSLNILPFRSGYEEIDRNKIQERLSGGNLKGVVSTSALELGIDIPHLNLGILVGVPSSSTSFFQRIGRIGRTQDGLILIINTKDIYNETIFRNPKSIFDVPLAKSSLYLENVRIQYIHALCLARTGGESEQVCNLLNLDEPDNFSSPIDWPEDFISLCNKERLGVIPIELRCIKEQAGEDPNHTFPLRDIDVQFQVEHRSGPERRFLGSLSYGQVMREAYPGAVYYYTTRSYRVFRVSINTRKIAARSEKKYTTIPIKLPTLVFPDLSPENIISMRQHGKLKIAECVMQIREILTGFKERRGSTETTNAYPLDGSTGIFFDLPRFTRNYFTSGVLISHPSLNKPNIKMSEISQILYESFLMVNPIERNDIAYSQDKYRALDGSLNKNDRFLCLYDQTYGSLRLSGQLMDEHIFTKVLEKAIEIIRNDANLEFNIPSLSALEEMLFETKQPDEQKTFMQIENEQPSDENKISIIMPGSKGLNISKDNEEFFVENVFYSPIFEGMVYRGWHLSEEKQAKTDISILIPYDALKLVPGESSLGIYNLETGEILPNNYQA